LRPKLVEPGRCRQGAAASPRGRFASAVKVLAAARTRKGPGFRRGLSADLTVPDAAVSRRRGDVL
jgi:hypothetical protein